MGRVTIMYAQCTIIYHNQAACACSINIMTNLCMLSFLGVEPRLFFSTEGGLSLPIEN